MKQLDPCLALAERLLTLTLVLDDAVAHGRTEDLDPILTDRQSLISEIERCTVTPAAGKVFAQVQAIEANTLAMLDRLRTESLAEIRKLSNTKRGLTSYSSSQAA